VMQKIRGADLDIDYDHKEKGGEAAGWVQAAEGRDDGLWLTVKWTKRAWDAIKAGEWRYFSPEYVDEWKDPKTQQVHKDVLFGGGLTNRPFFRDILPLNMSELFAERTEGNGMDPKELRKKLGLPEDATDAQVEERLASAADSGGGGHDDKDDKSGKSDDKDDKTGEPPVQIAAGEGTLAGVIQLKESKNPEVKALAEMVEGLVGTVQTQQAALHIASVNETVRQLSEPKAGRQFSAATQKLLTEALVAPPGEQAKKFAEVLEDVRTNGLVNVTEAPAGKDGGSGDTKDATKRFNEAVLKRIKDAKEAGAELDYGTAVSDVSRDEPQLFAEYRKESYAFTEND
jgi:phage I-like protein